MDADMAQMTVIGGGAWGTAIAALAARAQPNHTITLWAREADTCADINAHQENRQFLPGIALDPRITATQDLAVAAQADTIFLVVPAQFARSVLATLAPRMRPNATLVLCAKGIERDTGKFMSQMAAEYVSEGQLAVLSGPSFAADVARGLPTAVTLACADPNRGASIAATIGTPSFRPYVSQDVIGAEIGGAVKNVLAIACGIVIGREMGESARAALTARGFAEMVRLGQALGADPQTLAGLAGLGDLILTCASPQSRNFSLGVALGKGKSLTQVLGDRASVSEGAMSAEALHRLATAHDISMPISAAMWHIIDGEVDIDSAIAGLLARPLTTE